MTAYLHLSAQRVAGPHLHWIVRYGAVTVDPASLLSITAAADRR